MSANMTRTAYWNWCRQRRRLGGFVLGLVVATLNVALPVSGMLTAQQSAQAGSSLVRCNSTISLEKRLIMEQWAQAGACDRPVRTRLTDQFLGFTCVGQAGADTCRSFVPGPASRAFDTAKGFRCVDVALTEVDGGVAVSRVREWAAVPQQCSWDPSLGVLAMEVDFDNGQVCAAAFCMPVDRLSAIGKVRLRRLVTSAFQELDLMAQGGGPHAVGPVHAQGL